MVFVPEEIVIEQYLRKEVMPDRPRVSLRRSTLLIEYGLLHSVQVLRLAAFLEERFSIRVDPREIDDPELRCISDIAELVRSKCRAAQGRASSSRVVERRRRKGIRESGE